MPALSLENLYKSDGFFVTFSDNSIVSYGPTSGMYHICYANESRAVSGIAKNRSVRGQSKLVAPRVIPMDPELSGLTIFSSERRNPEGGRIYDAEHLAIYGIPGLLHDFMYRYDRDYAEGAYDVLLRVSRPITKEDLVAAYIPMSRMALLCATAKIGMVPPKVLAPTSQVYHHDPVDGREPEDDEEEPLPGYCEDCGENTDDCSC